MGYIIIILMVLSTSFISCNDSKVSVDNKNSHRFKTSSLIGTWHCNYGRGLNLSFTFDLEGNGIYEEITNIDETPVWYDFKYGIKDSFLIINLVDYEETDRYEIKFMNDKKLIILSEDKETMTFIKE